MSESRSPIGEPEYDLIEAAVMETERGRRFLREHARRSRGGDRQVLLEAIDRLEQALAGDRVIRDVERLRMHLRGMAARIARTKADIAVIDAVEREHSHLDAASEALDSVTRQTEQATSDILSAAEQIQEAAWALRARGADPDLCDDLDRRTSDIYTACSFQDVTSQRIAKIIQTLRYLEGRIDGLIALWEDPDAPTKACAPAPALGSPAHRPSAGGLSQTDVDWVITDRGLGAKACPRDAGRVPTPADSRPKAGGPAKRPRRSP
jgi:chemotaxis regulatin CheY-phosphate phosphatase CheZ